MTKETMLLYTKKMSEKLPVLRKTLGLSQQELANRAGLSRSTITKLEGGSQELTWNTFLSLLMIFTQNADTEKLLRVFEIYTGEVGGILASKDSGAAENTAPRSFTDTFFKTAGLFADETAVVDCGGTRKTSYACLATLSLKAASKILRTGIRRGTPVLINMKNCREYAAAYIGIQAAGCVTVPVTPDYPEERLAFIGRDCGAGLTVTEKFFSDIEDYEPAKPVKTEKNAPAHITYTSGSTGKPKGIVHSVGSVFRMTCGENPILDFGEKPVVCFSGSFSFAISFHTVLQPLASGAEVHLVDGAAQKDPELLAEYFLAHKINFTFLTPQLLKRFRNRSPYLRRVLVAGELMSNLYSGEYEMLNAYGSSETGLVSSFPVDRKYPNTPIGKPFPGCSFRLEPAGEDADADEGELCVTGTFADAYLNLPEKSAHAFEKLPDGTVVFHTGDYARREPDGNYTYLNRMDWMVKINGQRVETLEVESVLQELPQIKNAAVRAFTDTDGQNYLCAYCVLKEECSERDIRGGLAQKLPSYMLPRFFVKMESLPLNRNGKMDRTVLLPPSVNDYKAVFRAPENENQAAVCDAFTRVLDCGRVGIDDDFFALGGDSIKVMKLIALLEEKSIRSLTPADVLSEKTPERIAALVNREGAGLPAHLTRIPESLPLTASQRGLYLECADQPDSTVYNIPFAILLPEKTDIERFARAVETVAVCHPSLFVTVGSEDGEPVMHPGIRHCEIVRSTAESADNAKKAFVRPFDLEKGPLFRFELCKTPSGTLFLFDVHHLVFDGTSVRVFLDRIADAYDGKTPEDEKLTLFDIAADEKNIPGSAVYKQAQAFYRSRFSETEYESALIPDVDGEKTEPGASVVTLRSGDLLPHDDVALFTGRLGITESTLFTAAFAYALSVFSGSNDCFFTTACSGRHSSALSGTVGMFVKTLPLHFAIPENGSVSAFLHEVQNTVHQTLKYDCVPFGELAGQYGLRSDVSFVYQSDLLSSIRIGDTFAEAENLPVSGCQSDLLCMAMKSETGYTLRIQYRKNRFSPEMIKSVADTVFTVAGGMMSADSLGSLPLVTERDRENIDTVNRTEKDAGRDETLCAMLGRIMEAYPDNTALVCRDRSWSYREFDRLTNNLAAFFTGKQIGAEDFIAVLTPRSGEGVLAAWGAVRAGAAFQMLDPSYPAERLNYMVLDSGAKCLVADRTLAPVLTQYSGEILYTDEISGLPDAPRVSAADRPENAVTLIYTSGTTGKPKGCVLENRNLVAFCRSHAEIMNLSAQSRVASYASFGFDAGVMDIVSAPTSGACLYIVPDEIRLDISKLDEFYCENGITNGMMTTQVGRTFAEETHCKSLNAFMVGGEKLVPFTPQKTFRFLNGYGPCETMAYICCHEVTGNSSVQPIGKPVRNTKLYVTDRKGRLVPPCALGELSISGLQVGRGYLGLPEKTAEVFVKNPFSSETGYERMYRTGDIVRRLPDGNLEYIGRRDGQVKIRGFRVELTEIEEIIRRFEGIKDATVAAFDEKAGGRFLAAYVTSDRKVDTEALHAFIRSEKPAYMVPSVTMQIDAIPYTQNQKVNRRALPVPKRETADSTKPENGVQKTVFEAAATVLGHEDFGILTDLFEAGLTSIGTLKLNLLLGKAFDAPVKISDIREHPTVKQLAELLSGAKTETACLKAEDYPLMRNQTGVLLECGIDSETVMYNIPLLLKLSPETDVTRLRDAVCRTIDAHPYLKASLKTGEDGSFRAVRNDGAEPVVEIVRTPSLPQPETLVRPFSLMGGRLYRACIFLTEEAAYFFLDVHHIAADGMSFAVLLRDIGAAYAGTVPETERYTAYEAAVEEERLLAGGTEAADAYFERLLSGADAECVPGKCPETDAVPGGCACASFPFGGCSAAVTEYCSRNNLTANAFFNAVFGYVLARFSHSDDVVYCTVYHGRNDTRLADCVGMLVKTLPVRCAVNGGDPVSAYARSVQKQLVDTMTNDSVPFSSLSRKYGLKSDIFFNYQGDAFAFGSIGGVKAERIPVTLPSAKAPFSVEVFLEDGRYRADVTWRTDCFCGEFAAAFAGGLITAAEAFTREEKLCTVSVLSETEKRNFARMNATDVPFEAVPAHALFEAAAGRNPDCTAVQTAASSLTFGELDAGANALANALLKLGVKSGELIGLIAERSELVPVAELGIMKAGCAFLPMLPSYPDDRLEYCLTDAGCRIVLSEREIIRNKTALFSPEKPFRVYDLRALAGEENRNKPHVPVSPDMPAYCIYTSGSTGVPKGVLIEHHSLSCFVQTAGLKELESKGSTVMCMASISFDMSVTEIFFSLCCGNTVYIASEEEIHNLDLLLSAFLNHRIDLVMMTPSFAWSLLSVPEFGAAMANLSGIVLGAEAFRPALLAKLKALNGNMLVQNGYGPTECTQVCSVKTLHGGEPVTIGKPFANMKFYVADSDGNLLPRYALGELVICGENVCRGYLNLPEKNAAAFTEIDGVRAYRSGDLVRINRDNEAEFGGRADNQVKLRGFRVELDEVESVMQEYPGITQSKAVVRNNGAEDYLAAYFTAETPVNLEDLISFMRTKLTGYMIPAAMKQLDKMPMTQGGKLDKKALPDIQPEKKKRERRAPKKSLEEQITGLFCAALDLEECGVDENFFEIGGTSLSASKVVMQLKSAGYRIEYQDIFDHQTAEELSDYLESMRPKAETAAAAEQTGLSVIEDESIRDLLKCNSMEYASAAKREPLGTVLLTGATGFLGIHILKQLLDMEEGTVICLLRKGQFDDVETRLKSSLVYYFEDDFADRFGSRIRVVEGDITDDGIGTLFRDVPFDTLINCAASVKHFSNDSSISFINVHGAENMIALAKEKSAKLIQISTTSVPGVHNAQTYRVNLKMTEDRLFVVDDSNNQYIQSKYKAELRVLHAIREGLRGKIIRVGNLMGRYSDGEFQINMRTNAFLNGLKGFVSIGKCPVSHSTDPIKISPIDCTAKAVVLLAGTNDEYTAFNADSRCTFDEMKIIDVVNSLGISVKPVPDSEYYSDFNAMMGDAKNNKKVSALLTNDRPDVHVVETDNRFTANVLYRLGFSWPFVDDAYLEKIIRSLDDFDFFYGDD